MTDLEALLTSWRLTLTSRHRSERTIQSYDEAVRQLADFLDRDDLLSTTKAEVESFMSPLLSVRSSATASVRYRSLQQFFRWLAEEGEIETSPMGLRAEVGRTPNPALERRRRCSGASPSGSVWGCMVSISCRDHCSRVGRLPRASERSRRDDGQNLGRGDAMRMSTGGSDRACGRSASRQARRKPRAARRRHERV